MTGRERRRNERYILGDLMLELDGVRYETLDVARDAVAIVASEPPRTEWTRTAGRFISENEPALNQDIEGLALMARRSGIIVLSYTVPRSDWEQVLATHDVRADMKKLEDVFG
jgi:hypothetical protein